jgi:hypothetical protein
LFIAGALFVETFAFYEMKTSEEQHVFWYGTSQKPKKRGDIALLKTWLKARWIMIAMCMIAIAGALVGEVLTGGSSQWL